MNKRQRKNYDDFLNGTFSDGGIFEEPAKVTFKTPPNKPGPTLDTLIKNLSHNPLTLDPALAAKIKKLEAVINDTRAPAPERENARKIKEKLLRGG